MIRNVLTQIDGVGIYGVVSLTLFVVLFVAVVVWMLGLKPSYLDAMSRLPLDADDAHDADADPERTEPSGASAAPTSPPPPISPRNSNVNREVRHE